MRFYAQHTDSFSFLPAPMHDLYYNLRRCCAEETFFYACVIFLSLKILLCSSVYGIPNCTEITTVASSISSTAGGRWLNDCFLRTPLRHHPHTEDTVLGSSALVVFLKPYKTFCMFGRRSNSRSFILSFPQKNL